MSSSTTSGSTSGVDLERGSPFMMLPTEIRESIYRYLLISSHTMRTLDITRKDKYRNWYTASYGVDQTYHFFPAILRVNRRIYIEARDLCRRENDFICLTSHRPSRLGNVLEDFGLRMLAKTAKAQNFWNFSMTIILDPVEMKGWPYDDLWSGDAHEDGPPWKYIFSSDELPTFCRLLFGRAQWDNVFRPTSLYILINPNIWTEQAREMDEMSRVKKLVDPLHLLHSFRGAQVDGPLSGSYKGKIIESVCKDCPNALEILDAANSILGDGDDQVSKSQYMSGIMKYKLGLTYAHSCRWLYDEYDHIMDGGPFSELSAKQAMSNLEVRLTARIARAYFLAKLMRMARMYTDRAVSSHPSWRGWRGNGRYSISVQPWEGDVYAEVLHVAAELGYTDGHLCVAVELLEDAGKLASLSEEQKSKLRSYKDRALCLSKRSEKRARARKAQTEREDEKTKGMFLVARNRKAKGDLLLRDGRPDLAATKYKTAISKLDALSHNRRLSFEIECEDFPGHMRCVDAVNALRSQTQACVAGAYLNARRYKDASDWSHAVLNCDHFSSKCHHWNDNWEGERRPDHIKLHFCRGVALGRLGDTDGALEELEKAHGLDPGDVYVNLQLQVTREKREEVNNYIIKEKRMKLNAQQSKLYKKQQKRKSKARVPGAMTGKEEVTRVPSLSDWASVDW